MLSKDIRELSEADIRTRIAELEEERFRLRFRQGTETLEDPLRLRVLRKDVARLNTVLREKIIGIAEAGTSASLPKARSAKKTRVNRRTRTSASRSSKRT
jgi:large subunit ribosomal protein L29